RAVDASPHRVRHARVSRARPPGFRASRSDASMARTHRAAQRRDDVGRRPPDRARDAASADRRLAGAQSGDHRRPARPTIAALPRPPPPPSTDDTVGREVAALRHAIEQIAQQDPNQPFSLGVATVNVTASLATLSPVTDSLDAVDIQNRRALTVNEAIEYLPG